MSFFKALNGICITVTSFQRSASIICRTCTIVAIMACISSCTKNKDSNSTDAISISTTKNKNSNSTDGISLSPASLITSGITVTSVTGFTDCCGGVVNGRWTGNAPICISGGGTNIYNGYLVADCYNYSSPLSTTGSYVSNPYYWEINGSGFGASGTVSFSVPGLYAYVVSWTNVKIKIIPYGVIGFTPTSSPPGLNISPSSGGGVCYMLPNKVMPLIKSRGYGQCTYEVAYRRVLAGKSVPPLAFTVTGNITPGFVPLQYDVLYWGSSPSSLTHTGIITSAVTTSGSGSALRYNFTITERNAHCTETVSTNVCSYNSIANTGLLSSGYSSTARSYYR
jgi:hypothetical protein